MRVVLRLQRKDVRSWALYVSITTEIESTTGCKLCGVMKARDMIFGYGSLRLPQGLLSCNRGLSNTIKKSRQLQPKLQWSKSHEEVYLLLNKGSPIE